MDPGASCGGGSLGSHRRVVRWERFLPRRSLRVLLVEHDDCTRNIVTVLLHKCSYHVCAVADGIKAWEVLKEREYKVDLVLAEVAMSGVALLAKITATEECRNIPVIMMSSQDSIGVVLKCMLKGAADFLVKPVRKNELQNLWQHVWRRHCSSNYANASENNAASNHVSANGNDRSKTGEDSEEEPNAQSSDSKPSTEVESIMKHIECQVADGRSLSREEVALEQTDNNNDVLVSLSKMDDGGETRGCQSVFQHLDSEAQIDAGSAHANIATETELKLARPLHESTISDKVQEQNCSYDIPPYRMENLGYMRTRENYDNDARLYYQNKADSMEPTTNEQDSSHVKGNDALKQDAAHMQNTSDFGSSPLLELFLRRPQPNACTLQQSKERVILNHCNSAFSRYGDKRILISSEKLVSSGSGIRPREYGDSSQSHACNHDTENGSCAPITPKERFPSHQRNVSDPSSHLQASSETNKVDEVPLPSDLPMEDACAGHPSTGEETIFRYPQFGFIPLPLPFGAAPYQGLCAGYGAILQPMFYQEASISPNDTTAVEKETNQIGCEKPVHYDNHFSNPTRSNKFNHNDETESHHQRQLLDMDRQDPRDACTPMEHAYQSGSCSQNILRGTGSGSGETTDARAALESGNESGIRNCTFKGLREAALMKFRLKRKDRCFEKKVRYHSRKKLAEQRPRVKGQFVRQKILGPAMESEAGE